MSRNLPVEPSCNEIQPWHSVGGIEHICELRKSCAVLYGIFVELARLVYRDTNGRLIGTPSVVWSPKGTKLWIDNELRWEDQHPEVRPAIYIQLSPIQYQQYIDGRNAQVAPANEQGVSQYEHSGQGQVTFMHIASTVGEACALADNTEYALSMMQDPICRDFCFNKFFVVQRTAVDKLPKGAEASEKYASSVTFAFEFSEAWLVKEESPILKSIDILNSDRQTSLNNDNILTENKVSGLSR